MRLHVLPARLTNPFAPECAYAKECNNMYITNTCETNGYVCVSVYVCEYNKQTQFPRAFKECNGRTNNNSHLSCALTQCEHIITHFNWMLSHNWMLPCALSCPGYTQAYSAACGRINELLAHPARTMRISYSIPLSVIRPYIIYILKVTSPSLTLSIYRRPSINLRRTGHLFILQKSTHLRLSGRERDHIMVHP